jgi:NTE family protein
MLNNNKIGLALSGGGYRAAAFHLGVFKKLKELNILNNIHVLSTISGGSIIGVYYLLHKDNFNDFYTSFIKCLKTSTISKILTSARAVLTFLIFILIIFIIFYLNKEWYSSIAYTLIYSLLTLFFIYKIISFSDLVEKAYNKIFFGNKKLVDLPDNPIAAINATNLETGTQFTFSKNKMSDSSYRYPKDNGKPIEFICESFPLSVAVAASTAVPGPFNPIIIKKKYYKNENDYKARANPILVDGGVYDNQGIHKITTENTEYSCDIIICSDGSAPFKRKSLTINPLPILLRVSGVMMRRVRGLQMMLNVFYSSNKSIKEVTYYALDWNYENCIKGYYNNLLADKIRKDVSEYHNIPEEMINNTNNNETEIIEYLKDKIKYNDIIKNCLTNDEIEYVSDIGTNLRALSDKTIELLTRHASILTEIQIRLYCPSILKQT